MNLKILSFVLVLIGVIGMICCGIYMLFPEITSSTNFKYEPNENSTNFWEIEEIEIGTEKVIVFKTKEDLERRMSLYYDYDKDYFFEIATFEEYMENNKSLEKILYRRYNLTYYIGKEIQPIYEKFKFTYKKNENTPAELVSKEWIK